MVWGCLGSLQLKLLILIVVSVNLQILYEYWPAVKRYFTFLPRKLTAN
jgi:hypothetical protein